MPHQEDRVPPVQQAHIPVRRFGWALVDQVLVWADENVTAYVPWWEATRYEPCRPGDPRLPAEVPLPEDDVELREGIEELVNRVANCFGADGNSDGGPRPLPEEYRRGDQGPPRPDGGRQRDGDRREDGASAQPGIPRGQRGGRRPLPPSGRRTRPTVLPGIRSRLRTESGDDVGNGGRQPQPGEQSRPTSHARNPSIGHIDTGGEDATNGVPGQPDHTG